MKIIYKNTNDGSYLCVSFSIANVTAHKCRNIIQRKFCSFEVGDNQKTFSQVNASTCLMCPYIYLHDSADIYRLAAISYPVKLVKIKGRPRLDQADEE